MNNDSGQSCAQPTLLHQKDLENLYYWAKAGIVEDQTDSALSAKSSKKLIWVSKNDSNGDKENELKHLSNILWTQNMANVNIVKIAEINQIKK